MYLGDLDPAAVCVELYADALDGSAPVHHAMQRVRPITGAANAYLYIAQLPEARPPSDYTPRLIPYNPDASVPLEAVQIVWGR